MAAPRAAHRFAGVYDPSLAVIKACWERSRCLKRCSGKGDGVGLER